MAINTLRIANDDRLNKSMASLREQGHHVSLICVEGANSPWRRSTTAGESETAIRLVSRRFLKSGHFLWLKALEFSAVVQRARSTAEPDILWLHDLDCVLVPYFLRWRTPSGPCEPAVVWDQHELPYDAWFATRTFRELYLGACSRCDSLVMANSERVMHISQQFGSRWKTKTHVLENLPSTTYVEAPALPLSERAKGWLHGRQYVLASGGAGQGRRLAELVEAVAAFPDLALVVAGPCNEEDQQALTARFGDSLWGHVLLTGLVDQEELRTWLDHSLASVILYSSAETNLRLCAPNRLFQAMARGVPVIAGNNPPMAKILKELGCGYLLQDDGSDVAGLRHALSKVREQGAQFRMRSAQLRSLTWESQAPKFRQIIDSLKLLRC